MALDFAFLKMPQSSSELPTMRERANNDIYDVYKQIWFLDEITKWSMIPPLPLNKQFSPPIRKILYGLCDHIQMKCHSHMLHLPNLYSFQRKVTLWECLEQDNLTGKSYKQLCSQADGSDKMLQRVRKQNHSCRPTNYQLLFYNMVQHNWLNVMDRLV